MRRLVDTLIFVLVAYSLGWPLVRGVVDHNAAARTGPVIVAVRVPGLDVVPAARIRLAASAEDAAEGAWIAEGAQRAGVPGATLRIDEDLDFVWASVGLPGHTTTPIEVRFVDRGTIVELILPGDLRLVTGRVPPTNRHVRVSIHAGGGRDVVEVPCDARGGFVLALPAGDGLSRQLSIASERGRVLVERTVPGTTSVYDFGLVEP